MAVHDQPVGPFPPGSDHDEYDRRRRRVMWKLPTGLYLVGSVAAERRNLMTANLVSQVSLSPKLIGVSIEQGALTHELITTGRCFALSILNRQDRAVVRKFVKPAVADRAARTLNDIAYLDAEVTGSPVLASALAYLDCELRHSMDLGSHSWFIGEVVDAGFLGDENGEVLRMEDTKMSYGG